MEKIFEDFLIMENTPLFIATCVMVGLITCICFAFGYCEGKKNRK